ncbi:MAG TPA: response regulator transcription factor [Thermoanaerobaculia bacterium]|nr:response regulator transcription factor [Thermoanaerobaculia bacterium]
MPIRILIADDHAVVRSGLREILRSDAELEVVGEAENGDETLSLAPALHPDVVLLDITMPPDGGIETARRLHENQPDVMVLIVTMHENHALLEEALRVGAVGYLIKRAEESEILSAIHAVSRGEMYVHPSMTRALLHKPEPAQPEREAPIEPLTPRELDVLRLLAKGNTNKQSAALLGISVRTVENRRANLLGKLGISSRVELVSYAEEHDLI